MIDLHVHSTCSDGADTIEQVIARAKRQGVTHLSFVDHDTTLTYDQASPLARAAGITLIPGIEISAYDFVRQRKVHVLGYGYTQPAPLEALCRPLLERRHAHSLDQLARIQAAGYDVTEQQVTTLARDAGIIYKQHIMSALLPGVAWTAEAYQTLYHQLFKGQGVAAGDIEYVDVYDAVAAIRAAGGLAVIAHPGQLQSYELIEELVPHGLAGIEKYHPDHGAADHARVEQLATRYGLVTTGGSDYHGTNGAPDDIGSVTSEAKIISQLLTL